MSDSNEVGKQVKWIKDKKQKGKFLFTFDGEHIFNLFQDYPYKLTAQQKKIFDTENPYWADFFKDRNKGE